MLKIGKKNKETVKKGFPRRRIITDDLSVT